MNLENVIDLVVQKQKETDKAPFVIALAGFGGSGKSSIAQQLLEQLCDCTIVHLDDFIVNRLQDRSSDWNSFDWHRLESEILQPLLNGNKEITYSIYDWETNEMKNTNVLKISKFVIVEGVGLIRPTLLKYFNYKIWINCPLDVARERGKKRDREIQKVNNDTMWDEIWSLNDKDYFDLCRPDKLADFILDNN